MDANPESEQIIFGKIAVHHRSSRLSRLLLLLLPEENERTHVRCYIGFRCYATNSLPSVEW
jgi:hypothetical protein